MGKKVMLAVAVMAFVVGATGLHFLSPAAAKSDSAAKPAGKTVELTLKQTDSKELDLGAKGLSAGDQFIFSGDFFERDSDDEVGDYGGYCVVIHASAADDGNAICTVTLTSDSGQTVAVGSVAFEDVKPGGSYKLALVGGTGDFKGKRGQFIIEIVDEDEADLTIEYVK